MSTQQLKDRLKAIALLGIAEANRANPFISKSEAFKFFNEARLCA